MSDDPDPRRVQEQAQERQHEQVEHTEHILERVDALVTQADYPTTSEELATIYADQEMDLPNETESLGSVFDRMVDEEFETPTEAREAIYDEVTGEADGQSEFNDQRDLQEIEEDSQDGRSESGGTEL